MYIGIGFLLFPPLCLTWWWYMNTSIHHKEKRRFLSHLSVLLFFLTSSVAWLIGWALILEYTIGGSSVARGMSPNLVILSIILSYLFREVIFS